MTQATRPPKPPSQGIASTFTQMYPPKPTYTEDNVPDLSGKICIVTGASSGVGKALASVLYSKNAKVYVAARSEPKARAAMAEIKKKWAASSGELVFLHLDLSDLAQVRGSAQTFLGLEARLDVLFNNAATQALGDTDGSHRTAQGHEQHLGVNVLGPFLFTKLLAPLLAATARGGGGPAGSVRVVWVSSMGLETIGEKSKGLSPDYVDYWPAMSPLERYGLSKAGSWLHAVDMARRYRADGVVSVPVNPGHLASDLYREGGCLFRTVLSAVALYPCINGAYVELYGAFSPDITLERSGDWVVPWGRFYPLRSDLVDATKLEEEGGNGHAKKFWDWSEEQVKDFV